MTNPDGSTTGYDDIGAGSYSGIAALLGGFYDTTVSSQTARKNTDKTIAAQKDEAEKAYQRQVEMWHLQNAYNSPAEQMKRFGAAGLNPHLIYGQGNPGNASDMPKYQAPNLQYRYEAPTYGAAAATGIQQLMQVGTWMQNMRLSEQELQKGESGVASANEALRFLMESNPRKLQDMDNRLSMYPYQKSLQRFLAEKGNVTIADMLEEFRQDWGIQYETEFGDYTYKDRTWAGTKGQDLLKKIAERKIAEAKASWTDFNITDPQSLIEMVLKGVMGMAGQTMRINPKGRPTSTNVVDHRRTRPKGLSNVRRNAQGRGGFQNNQRP